ncbi:tetratricopeptide repeat protein [Oculatella sp. LEGE 06141]|nr:tetratricopeptide repeat protein [Oculatella sp. LEGE 06141]
MDDPQGLQRKLIPIRVEECTPEGLLKPIVYVDLVGRSEAEAQQDILSALKDRAKPAQKTIFPGDAKPADSNPIAFPTEPNVWAVPHDRNPFFTGRDAVLQDIQETFAKSRTAALCGMRGVGKTQTAIEFAHRYRYDYGFVFWVRAETREELISGWVEIASELQLSISREPDHNVIVATVRQWLATHSDWLLILDNADDLKLVQEFLPKGNRGHILLTSTAQATGRMPQIELNRMSLEEGALFLLRRAKLVSEQVAFAETDQGDRTLAETICREMDGLPLALDQAGAYIEETPSSLDGYLELYRDEKTALLTDRGELVVDDHPCVTVTFSLAFSRVEERSLAAADLIRVCAFLAPDAIPEEIFTAGAAELGDRLSASASRRLEFDKVIKEATRFSLMAYKPQTKTFNIHRLVQEVLKAEMDEATQRVWVDRSINTLAKVFPNPQEFENWGRCDRFLNHILMALDASDAVESENKAFLLNRTGVLLKEQGLYREAEPLLVQALDLRRGLLGEEHPDVAASMNNLAGLYESQGRYGEAEPLYVQALDLRRGLLGEEHPDVAASMNNLAGLYESQGRYGEAEPLYVQALDLNRGLLGEEHPDVATSMNDLAVLYESQGRYGEAEPLYVQALDLYRRLLGEEHPYVATSMNSLAVLYKSQGRYGEAEPLYVQALDLRRGLLGEEHPDVATSMNNLAGLYGSQGRYGEAEPLYVQALDLYRGLLGEEHPDVATSMNNLAGLYGSQGRYGEAEPLYVQALDLRRGLLGEEHPAVAASMNNLAVLYCYQHRFAEAEPLLIQALEMCDRLLGANHPDTISTRQSLEYLRKVMNSDDHE